MPRDARINLLLQVYDQAFDHKAWHGTPLWGSLRGLRPQGALWRPGRGRHNIWEVVLHTAYWKYIVRRRLARDATLSFPRAGDRKSTRLNSSHGYISYAVFCLKKKKKPPLKCLTNKNVSYS